MHKKTKKQIKQFVKDVYQTHGEKETYTLDELKAVYDKSPESYPSQATLFYKTKFKIGYNLFSMTGKKPKKVKKVPEFQLPEEIKNNPLELFKFLFDK